MTVRNDAEPAWTEWGGGPCPVGLLRKVDVQTRAYGKRRGVWAIFVGWLHRGWGDDVVAYRLAIRR